ncbi:MAG TPA: hypothetical protein VEV86_08645 [Vicinamibacterales bacterium]|nr:hypothetical protein [Vicinamibacterales bacterium]
MTHRFPFGCLVVAAVVAMSAPAAAQGPRMTAERLAELAKKATPHLADGKSDLNGTWDHLGGIEFVRPQNLDNGSVCVVGCPPAAAAGAGGAGARAGGAGARAGGPPAAPPAPNFPKYKQEFLAKVKDLSERQVEVDTALQCQPPGVPRIGPPAKIVQTAREVLFLYDDVNGSFFRIIPTDGRAHRKDLPASYLGDAIGRYEGDTLVVETVNFNEETWLSDNGAFHTKDLKVIERLRRVGDTLQYEATASDPSVLVEPWKERTQTLWLTDREIEESPRCEDRDLDLIKDGSHHDNPR